MACAQSSNLRIDAVPSDYRHLGKFCAVELAIEVPPLCFDPGVAQHHHGITGCGHQAAPKKKERFGKMPDKAQERIAEELRVASFDFLSAVKQGVVSPAQRSALERALTNAKDLSDALYCAAITKARIEAAYRA
jgi:hypothetical protein